MVGSTNNTDGQMGRETITVMYYYAQNTSATVNHIDYSTGTVLASETKTGKVGDVWVTEAKDIVGYIIYQEPDNKTIEMTKDVITLNYYYIYVSEGVVEKHINKLTGELMEPAVLHNGNEGETYEISAKIFEGYQLVDSEQIVTGVFGRDQAEVKFYYVRNANMKVKYLDINTGEDIADEIDVPGKYGDEIDLTQYERDIFGYVLIEKVDFDNITMNQDSITIEYKYAKLADVTVKYLEKSTNAELADEVTIEGYEGKDYTTEEKTFENYVLIEVSGNTDGQIDRDGTEVIYYYAQRTNVNVEYVDKYTGGILDSITITSKDGDTVTISSKSIDGYTLIESPANEEIQVGRNDVTEKYYYAKNTNVKVQYLEKGTEEVLTEEEAIEGYQNKDYSSDSKDIENYTLIENPDNASGKMARDTIYVKYYYAQNTEAKVNYVDKNTGEILATETRSGKVGDSWVTSAKEISEYVLDEEPDNKEIIMAKNVVTLTYYYVHVSEGVVEKHVDKITGSLLEPETLHEGNEGDEYEILAKSFNGYSLANAISKVEGRFARELIEVIFYYIRDAHVRVQYIDSITGNKIIEDEIIPGYENDEYTVEVKTFDGYVVNRPLPTNLNGNMRIVDGAVETLVKIYYTPISAGVIERHIDSVTGDEIAGQRTYTGVQGENYETSSVEVNGYDLLEVPANASGTLGKDEIVVTYRYSKKAQVEVKYVDKVTGEELDNEVIRGHVGDYYESEEKAFDQYVLVDKTVNISGTLKASNEAVTYYYSHKATVIVEYYEAETKRLLGEKVISGLEGDQYTTEQLEFDYHKLSLAPENAKGVMTVRRNGNEVDSNTLVEYYYRRLEFNFKVDSEIKSMNTDGVEISITNGKLEKIEVGKDEMIPVIVKYQITVTNAGELGGYVNTISDRLPEGAGLYVQNTYNWVYDRGVATLELDDVYLEPGETKVFDIAISIYDYFESLGTKKNVVAIERVSNAAFYKESTLDDNTSATTIILGIKTGTEKTSFRVIIGIALALCFVALVIDDKREKVKKSAKYGKHAK